MSGTVAGGTADTITNTATTNSASLTDPTPTDNTAVASSTLAVPDNLVSNTNDSGWGSLRYAIGNAAPGSAVTFDPTLFSSLQVISLTSGSLIIDRDVTIQGPGANLAVVDGTKSASVFVIQLGVATTVSSLTIQNGKTQVDFSGGGFVNEGTLTVENSIVSHNTSSIYGGGIFNEGMLTVSNSTISYNTAGSYGGGFDNHLATATIINSTISDNSTTMNGGGINNSGPLTIIGSTIANNTAGAGAGMITGDDVVVLISNSTFTGNVASAFAGAIQNGSNLTISNSTISGNTAKGTGVNSGGTGGVLNQRTLNLGSTIIAGNTASINGTDVGGLAISSLGNNVIGDTGSVTGFGSSDQTGTSASPLNAQLGPLANNGGPTLTMALQANSPAIRNGNCNLTTPAISVTTDQRGVARKSPCDVGAYEVPSTTTAFTPSSGPVGTAVILTGSNFMDVTSVKFNDTPAIFSINNDTTITTSVPTGATTGPITLVSDSVSITTSTSFTVNLPPTITSFTPTSSIADGSVTINGTHFIGATSVKFARTNAVAFTVESDTAITTNVPFGASSGQITVTTPSGTATSSTNFTVPLEAPSGLNVAQISATELDVNWTDMSSSETAFKIERSFNGATNWAEIGSVVGNTTSYQDMLLDCGTAYYYRVRAYRSSDTVYSTYSNTATATTATCSLGSVTLSSPADGTLTNNNSPTFTWLATSGADTYEIQIDNNSDFSSPEQDHNGPDLNYTATTLADGTTYSWRVRALNNNNTDVGPWSTPRTLVINHVTLPPPMLSLPAVNANVAVTKPTFMWVAVAGAAKYNLQIDDDPTFASPPPVHALGKVTTYAAQLSDGLQYGTTYYWRVQAGDASSVFGDWSGIRAFTVTLLKTPTNGAYSTSTTPTFTWAAVTGATAYDFEVSSDATFATTANDTYSGLAISHVVPLAHALSAGAHYWRVRVTTSSGTSPWMGPWTLIVTPTLPAAPVQLLPAANALTSNATPDFSWKPTATSGHFTYQLQIATASTFYGPVQDVVLPVDTTTYTALTLPDGVYYWRVRAINNVNAAGAWSAKRLFTVNTTPAPKLTAPKDWSGTTSTRPTFSWSAFAGAKYMLQVFVNNGTCSTSQYSTGNLTAASYSLPLANALPAGEYCWNVLATDALGHVGTPSPFFRFTVNANITPPAAPTLTSPATASQWTPSSVPDLTWTGPAGDTFEVQIDTVTTFTHPVQDAITVVDGHTFTVSSLSLPAGLYYWHVRTINAQGIASAYAVMRSFTLKTAIPAAPKLLLPAQNGITPSLHPTLSWQAVTGAKSYILLVATDASFTTLVVDQAVLAPAVSYAMTTETLDYGQTYYWQVQAVDAVGNTSLPSSTFHFTVTIQTMPVNGSSTALVRPTFQWQAVTGALHYQLQLASDAAFNTIVAHYDNLQVTKFTLPPSDPALSLGTYYWRVQLTTGSGTTPMPGWSLAETTGTVGVPVLSTPATNAITNDNTPTFNWKAATSAQQYEIEIGSTSTFVSPQVDTVTAPGVLTYIPTALADGTYYWRVRSINSYGAGSAWSAVWSLSIDTVLPAAPDLLGPANNTITTNPALTLRWNAVTGAAKYEVAIGTSNPPTTPPIPLGNVTTYLISPTLAQGDYFWQVRAIDAAGNVGPWSTPTRKFTIAAGMSSASVKPKPTMTATPTVAPTFAPPTNTPVAPSPTPIQLMTVEAESTSVTRIGNWTARNTSNASGGAYLFSSGQAGDALTLGFGGTHLDIVFVKHPAFGSFAVEIDGVLLQTVDAHATQSAFGAQLSLDSLAPGTHTLRIYAINGTVALDAFHVDAVTTLTQQNAPTIAPTFAPPTNTPQPTSTPSTP